MQRIAEPALEVRDFRLVLALSQEKTTARAAAMLHLAQPSVSRALISLEGRLGTQLFHRTPRGLVATRAGERVAARASDLLEELTTLERGLGDALPVTRIRVACECYTAYHWLPTTLIGLRAKAPELSLALRIEHTDDAYEALRSGSLDAALLTAPRPADECLLVEPLLEDEMVFAVAVDHPLAKKKFMSPGDLERHPLFTPGPTPEEARWFMNSVFGRARPRLDVTRVPFTEAIVDLARAGLGIGILTEWVVGPHLERGGIVVKSLARRRLKRPWHLGWRRDLGDAGPRLLAALQPMVPQAGG